MAQPIYRQDIARYRDQVKENGVAGVISVYSELLKKGYDYAGWAKGVAEASGLNTGGLGGTVTGRAAVLFMKNSSGREFTKEELDSIRIGMARGYLAALEKNIDVGGKDWTQTDTNYKQTREFHRKVFVDHGLSLDNWTLETPMKLIGHYEGGEAAQEAEWQKLLKTQGDYADALFASNGLYEKVSNYADGHYERDRSGRVVSGTPSDYAIHTRHKVDAADQEEAKKWISKVDIIKPLLMSRNEEWELQQKHGTTDMAQPRSLTIEDMPKKARELCRQCKTLLAEFDQEKGITRNQTDYDTISRAMGIQAYAAGLPEVQFIHIQEDGQINIGYESPQGMFKDTSIHTDKALATTLKENVIQSRQAERDLALAAEQRAMEIGAYEQSQSMGRSIG